MVSGTVFTNLPPVLQSRRLWLEASPYAAVAYRYQFPFNDHWSDSFTTRQSFKFSNCAWRHSYINLRKRNPFTLHIGFRCLRVVAFGMGVDRQCIGLSHISTSYQDRRLSLPAPTWFRKVITLAGITVRVSFIGLLMDALLFHINAFLSRKVRLWFF